MTEFEVNPSTKQYSNKNLGLNKSNLYSPHASLKVSNYYIYLLKKKKKKNLLNVTNNLIYIMLVLIFYFFSSF
jgi:hypothetical protein